MFGRLGALVANVNRLSTRCTRAGWAYGAVVLSLLVLGAPSARAEPLCTDTWTGPGEGTWQAAADWSAERVPTSTDIACIGAGKTVRVSEGTDQAAVVEGEGALSISGGSLELAGALEEGGRLHSLTLAGGTLEGAGALRLSAVFSWTGGTMSGSGSTVLESGVTSGAINPGAGKAVSLTKRELVNDGTLTWSSGSVEGRSSAEFDNGGTLVANANVPGSEWSSHGLLNSDGTGVWLRNTGTIRKASGSEFTTIQFQIANEGTVEAATGQIIFSGSSHTGGTPSGSWLASEGASISFNGGTYTLGEGVKMEGVVFFAGGVMHASDVQGAKAHVYLWSAGGTLELTSVTTVSHVKELTINSETTLDGAAALNVSSGFSWAGGTMSGSGSTTLGPGVSSSIAVGPDRVLAKRSLVNEGSLTIPAEAGISGKENAALVNHGTLVINAEGETRGLFVESPSSSATLTNTGTVQKTAGSGISRIGFVIDNEGTVSTSSGELELTGGGASGKEKTDSWSSSGAGLVFGAGSYELGGTAKLAGGIIVSAAHVAADKIEGSEADLAVTHVGSCCEHGTVEITGPGESTVSGLLLESGTFTGSAGLEVSGALQFKSGTLAGTGETVIESGATGSFEGGSVVQERALVNDGVATWGSSSLEERDGAKIMNLGTFDANSEAGNMLLGSGATSSFVNEGVFQKTSGTGTTQIEVDFESYGVVRTLTGKFHFTHAIFVESANQFGGAGNPSAPEHPVSACGDPVDCATGNLSEGQTDFAIGGRGVGLELARTYNSQAGAAGTKGVFGYGWTSSFSDYLVVEKTGKTATVHQADGSTVAFAEAGEGSFTAPAWTQDTLTGSAESGYTLTLANQVKYKFSGSNGRLESVTDRDGNATTLGYSEGGRLETITDPVSRKIKLTYNGEGLVESVEDPMGHVTKYTYEGGNLKSVTQSGEASLRWQFKYDGSHQLTEMVDGRGGRTVNEYNSAHQVISQKDPAERKLKFEYEPFHTKITNETTGSVTDEWFTSNDEPFSITRGYGTASATTESFTYNEGGYVTSATDGNGHTTKYGYDAVNDRTSTTDSAGDETKWTYDAKHYVETTTTPRGETTTIKRDEHGNPEVVERPAPESKTQITKYKYAAHGELESVTDPLEHAWKYGYDSKGDRTSETDPEGNKRTWEYNEDSQETATVSPNGNVEGAEPSKFTTTTERDARGRPLKITDPLGHTTKYTYDGDGNVEALTNGNGHTTTYTYNADNEPVKVKEPNGEVAETEYDGAGQVTAQIDGNKHRTKYTRNALEEVTEVTDPLGRKTTKEYDSAGNLKSLTDPAERTTTYTYDPVGRLTKIGYSDGKTPTVEYEYNKDGDRTKMIDGTGTTTYAYDQLDRLTESEDGNKEVVKYEYDLADKKTRVTYPNAKAMTRAYDKDGRLEAVTDWLSNTTKFEYDPNSNLKATTLPGETKDEDRYAYNDADQMSEVKMLKGTETLASLAYTRDNDGQVKTTTATGLPGLESTESAYDENNRLAKSGGTEYEYDSADNPTKIGSNTQTFNEASELEKSAGVTYSYDELGERTKSTPEKGPATVYGHDQAGNLTSVERPKEGETTEIKDTYTYDGNGLRATQTTNGTTSHLAWDQTEGLPLILSDGANSYVYGPGGLPVEQISGGGAVTYLHHDQAGSTRLLTGSTGTVEGSYTYDAYGNIVGHTGTATTPLGYDGQYTSTDTGLIYMRDRVYDPATAQFLTVDPLEMVTRAPYNYASDNPVNHSDPTGLGEWEPWTESFWTEGNFISNSPLNPIPYYEQEIESYENGCGYFASVAHGLEGAVAGTALFAGGEGADEADITVSDVLKGKLGSIRRAPLAPGSPSWTDIADMSIADVRAAAKANEPGYKTILKLLTSGEYNKP